MPYEHIEQIGDRSEERFALGLGARNVAGIMLGIFPMLLVSGTWPLIVRVPAMLAAMVIGFLATVTIQGLPTYAWPLWWARGHLTMLLNGRTITPEQLPGVAQPMLRTPLRVGGPIRVARRASVRSSPNALPIPMGALGRRPLATPDDTPPMTVSQPHASQRPTAEQGLSDADLSTRQLSARTGA